MGFMDKISSLIAEDDIGKISEISTYKLQKKYRKFLLNKETILAGFTLGEVTLAVTNSRLIEFTQLDKYGERLQISAVYLDSLMDIIAEINADSTRGSKITLVYIASPYYRTDRQTALAQITYEFSKRIHIEDLYHFLLEIVCLNRQRING